MPIPKTSAAPKPLAKKIITLVKDIKIPNDYDLKKVGLTQSRLHSFQKCRQLFLYEINRWEPDRKNKNTQFGTFFHDMIDKAYHEVMPPNYQKIGAWIDDYVESNDKLFKPFDVKEVETMAALIHVLLDEYIKHYKEDWTRKKFTAIEEAFDLTFQGFRIRGRKDGTFDDKGANHWIMEHKTKSVIDEEFLMLALSFDLQNLFYITAEELERKIKVKGVLYNVVRKPGTRQRSMESGEAFSQRVRKEIQKKPSHYFKRFEVFYTEQDKERFKRELLLKLKEIQDVLTGKLPIYRNESACHNGNFKCNFLEACASGSMAGYRQKRQHFVELEAPAIK